MATGPNNTGDHEWPRPLTTCLDCPKRRGMMESHHTPLLWGSATVQMHMHALHITCEPKPIWNKVYGGGHIPYNHRGQDGDEAMMWKQCRCTRNMCERGEEPLLLHIPLLTTISTPKCEDGTGRAQYITHT